VAAEVGSLVVTLEPRKRADAASVPGGLTRRAWLTAVASVLDYTAKIIVSFVVTPILVNGLGRSLFGVWEMLGRLGSYASVVDGRSTEALRLVLGQHQHSGDDAARRRLVGGALTVWLLLLPIILAAGALLCWLAPSLTRVPPPLHGDVRLTSAFLLAAFLLKSLAAVPESVLRGMNLGYKRMGWQAGLNVLAGALAAGAVWTGLGLVGLGGAQVVQTVAAGLCFLWLARVHVARFGAARPSRAEVKSLFGLSVWLSAGDAIAKVLLASDVIILGAVVGPWAVTTYALNGYAARAAVGVHVFAAGAPMPGLGGILGRRQLARAERTREDLLTLTWLFATVVGGAILLWNRSLVTLWVGGEYYGGVWINVLLVLLAVQTVFIRTDAYVIDATLQPRLRVLVSGAAAVLSLGLGMALTHAFGMIGLLLGLLAGRATQSVAYPLLARVQLDRPARAGARPTSLRRAACTAVCLGGAAVLGHWIVAAHWLAWAAGVAGSVVALTSLAIAAGLDSAARRRLFERGRALYRKAVV
jgi:O-antigen/teichoic acid export membrane protein